MPALPWAPVLGGALLISVLLASSLELHLALRDFQPTTPDSEALWVQQRARAGALGERALILVGASRIQLDVELATLRARTGLEPVQLAIDGSSFLPVLEGLTADAAIRGTVLVDFSDHLLTYRDETETSYRWQAGFERLRGQARLPDFQAAEAWLGNAWRQRLRSYADGAQPLTSLRARVLDPRPTPQYLVTRPDRSRLADYSKVEMPGFYFARVMRNLGQTVPITPGMTAHELDQELRRRIAALTPQHGVLDTYRSTSRALAAQAAAIRARGGRVFFLMLPKSGLVRAIDDRRFPRAQFWDRFALEAGSALHFEDVPAWRPLACPDGSHLDFRQRTSFTHALVDALGLAGRAD